MKYFYLIPKNELVYDMVKFSLMTLEINQEPKRADVIIHRDDMRCVEDDVTKIKYTIVKMGIDFSTPFRGYPSYTKEEFKIIDREARWVHNKPME